MFEWHISDLLSAAHQIEGHPGKCQFLHGHNWRVIVSLACDDPAETFQKESQIREIIESVLDRFDHTNLNDLPEFKQCSTTAENISRVLFETLESQLRTFARLKKVAVWETPKYCASYQVGDL